MPRHRVDCALAYTRTDRIGRRARPASNEPVRIDLTKVKCARSGPRIMVWRTATRP